MQVPPLGAASEIQGVVEAKMLVGLKTVGARNFQIIHLKLAPGAALGARWNDFEQVYFTLSGKGVTRVNGKDHLMEPGGLVWLPMGSVHETKNTDDQPLVCINVSSPPAFSFTEPNHPVKSPE